MTQIDFHTDVPDQLHYACRLIRKACARQTKLVVHHEDPAQLRALDQLLWTFSDVDFLPHVMQDDALAARTPVVLASTLAQLSEALPQHELLINLSTQIPDGYAQFRRMIEIVRDAEDERQAGRTRYLQYKQHAHPLTHTSLKKV